VESREGSKIVSDLLVFAPLQPTRIPFVESDLDVPKLQLSFYMYWKFSLVLSEPNADVALLFHQSAKRCDQMINVTDVL
jgi:hypothetical protein